MYVHEVKFQYCKTVTPFLNKCANVLFALKGLSVKATGEEKSSNLSEIRQNTCQSQHVPFFLKKLIDNGVSSDFI